MRNLKTTDNYSTLIKVTHTRVTYDETDEKVYFIKGIDNYYPNHSIYWKINNNILYLRATPKEDYQERILYVDGAAAKNGWYTASTKTSVTKTIIEEEIAPTSCCRFFDGMSSLQTFENWELLKMGHCLSTKTMFQLCSSLTTVDCSQWETLHVTDMAYMFNMCDKLQSVGNLNGWDVSKVTNMQQIFNRCFALTSLNIAKWDVKNVTNMKWMLSQCTNILSIGDLSNWDTSNVTTMFAMFNECYKLQNIGDLNNWNTSNVTDMDGMFYQCYNLQNIGDLSNWDVSNVTDMSYMFAKCNVLMSTGDLNTWNTSNVTTMTCMFNNCYKLQNIGDLNNWNVSKVTDMSYMFTECNVLTSIGDLSNWDVSKVTTMYYMFRHCYNINGSDYQFIGQWHPNSCTNFVDMNTNVGQNYAVIDGTWSLPNWVLNSSCTSMSRLCHYGPNFKIIDLSNLDFSKITYMGEMFVGCRCSVVKFGKNISETVGLANIFVYANSITDLYFDGSTSTTAWQRIADQRSSVTVHIGEDRYKKVDGTWSLVTT